MPTRLFNPQNVSTRPIPYSHGAEVKAGSNLLFMSGQVGRTLPDGDLLPDFEGQIRQTYINIKAVLNDVGMDFVNIVKMTTYITDRNNLTAMREIRKEILGDHKPAHTLVIVAGLAFEEYLIEVDCTAAI
ncbi:MAG: RidA family protein [Pseudomonadota bacterium]|nr:RidA family protein [Pseudomonadota bacterium]